MSSFKDIDMKAFVEKQLADFEKNKPAIRQRYIDELQPTFIHRWSPKLMEMRNAMVGGREPFVYELSVEDMKILTEVAWSGKWSGESAHGEILNISKDIEEKSKSFFSREAMGFMRLSSRSPKDAGDCMVKNVSDIMSMLSHSSRLFDDMCGAIGVDEPLYLYVFPWAHINTALEFRAFIHGGLIVGISQNRIGDIITWDKVQHIHKQITERSEIVIKEMPIPNFTIDFVEERATGDMMFIEVNPWGLSDPMMFDTYANIDLGKDGKRTSKFLYHTIGGFQEVFRTS